MAEPNASDIKDRIIATLKSNKDLWQEEDRSKGLMTLEFGLPSNQNFQGLNYPACYVTNAPNFEDDKPFGGVTDPNVMGTSEHQFRFRIMFFSLTADGADTERELDGIQKLIKETLKANNQLRDPKDINNKATALATESFPMTTRSFAVAFEGQDLDGRVITFRVRVQSDLS